ncbi:MAG: hypothetical protein ACQES2_06535 [Pseudomonadota bacterium]
MSKSPPNWATFVAVMTIILGLAGVFGGAQKMLLPTMLDFQRETMSGIAEKVAQENGDEEAREARALVESFEGVWDLPDWYRQWAMPMGLVSLLVALALLVSGAMVMMLKASALRAMSVSLGLAVIWGAAQATVYLQSDNYIIYGLAASAVMGAVFCAALLLVVLMADKTSYRQVVASE